MGSNVHKARRLRTLALSARTLRLRALVFRKVYACDVLILFDSDASFVDKESNQKYYFVDNGIVNLFCDDKRTALFENAVAIKLYRQAKESLYYLKGNKVDVDFYISDKNVAVQAAYSIKEQEAFEREVDNLLNYAKSTKAPCKLMIVTFEEETIVEKYGFTIEVVPLKKFLLLKDL